MLVERQLEEYWNLRKRDVAEIVNLPNGKGQEKSL